MRNTLSEKDVVYFGSEIMTIPSKLNLETLIKVINI